MPPSNSGPMPDEMEAKARVMELGAKFHDWTVIALKGRRRKHVLCVCSCGTERSISRYALRHELTTSCGCRRRFRRGERHGHLLERYCPEPNTGCWLWTGNLNRQGYGQADIYDGNRWRKHPAHRVFYEANVGPAGDRFVLHRCDTPACVNPAHLFLGDARANYHDMVRKGRAAWQKKVA